MTRALSALVLVLLALVAPTAQASDSSCANPQAAMRSLLDWQQPAKTDLVQASRCLDMPQGMESEAPQVAVQLKRVLDARGLYVHTDEIPGDPGYTNEAGQAVVTPVNLLPELRLVKSGDQWMIAQSTVEATPGLYDATFSGFALQVQRVLPEEVRHKNVVGLEIWQWVYAALLLLVSMLAGLLIQALLAGQLVRLAERAHIKLDPKIVKGTRVPLTLVAICIVAVAGIPDLQLSVRMSQGLLFIARTTLSVAAVLVAVRLVDTAADFFVRRAKATDSKLDDQVIPLATRGIKILLWALGVMFVIQNMGFEIASLLAGVSIGGVAVALAAKDTVENLFGSVLIFLDKPFQIGDWVVVDGDVEGVVEEVGFRSTRVRSFYGSLVTVPNAKVANASVDNKGWRKYRRCKPTLSLTYDSRPEQIEAFVADLRTFLAGNEAVADDAACEVHFAAFGSSSLDISLYFFFDVETWTQELEARAACYLEFMRMAEKHGLSFAFPSTSLYVEKLPAGVGQR